MKRHGKKRGHSHIKNSVLNGADKASNIHSAKEQPVENKNAADYAEDIFRKHKHKKSEKTKLTLWEGLILLLILKENGILEELLEIDEYKEFDIGHKNSKFNKNDVPKDHNKNCKNKNHQNKPDKIKNNKAVDFEHKALEYEAEEEIDEDIDEEINIKSNNEKSHFDFEYFFDDDYDEGYTE